MQNFKPGFGWTGGSLGGLAIDGRTRAAAEKCARVRGSGSSAAGQGTGRDGAFSSRTVQEGRGTGTYRSTDSGIGGRRRLRPPCLHHSDRRNFAVLRLDGRDSLRPEFALLRSHSSLRDGRTEERIPAAIRARRKDWLLRTDRTASRLERRSAANEGGEKGRCLRAQWNESLDHERRRGRRSDCVREHGAREGRERHHRAGRGKRHAGISGRQGREETGNQCDGLQ